MVLNLILRFLGRMPRGRFEYTCPCGNYEITQIPTDKDVLATSFECKKCHATIRVWEQTHHWHLSVEAK